MWASPGEVSRYSVEAGDLVVAEGGDVGRPEFVGAAGHGSIIQNSLHRIRLRGLGDIRYMRYVLSAIHGGDWLDVLCNRATFGHLTVEKLSALRVPYPRAAEQRAIADFLDTETTRIDTLITKKRQMIDLLSRRTESVIGFFLDAERTKWGELPLRAVADLRVSNVDKKSYEGQVPVRLCNYTDVYYQREITSDLDFMQATADDRQAKRLALRAGDVLITKDSETANDIAVPAYVPSDLPGVVLGYHLALLRPHRIDGRFLYWSLLSRQCRDAFTLAASGVTRFGLRQEGIRSVPMPATPIAEQVQIVAAIEEQVTAADAICRKLVHQIDLLVEHRQALVTAAVTGELEVSGVAA